MALYKYHYIELDTKRSPRISLQNIVAGETGNRLWITVTNNGETVDMSEKEDGEYIYRVCLVIKSNLGVRRQDSATEDSGITLIDANTGDHGKVNILLSKDSFTAGKNRARLEIYSTRSEENDTLIVSAEWTFDVEGADEGDNVGLATPLLVEYEQSAKRYADIAEALFVEHVVDPSVYEWMEAHPSESAAVIDAWLDAHPEATTTVEDGAITKAKLNASLIAMANSIDEHMTSFVKAVNDEYIAATLADFDADYQTYTSVNISNTGVVVSSTGYDTYAFKCPYDGFTFKTQIGRIYVADAYPVVGQTLTLKSVLAYDASDISAVRTIQSKGDIVILVAAKSAINYYLSKAANTVKISNLCVADAYDTFKQNAVIDSGVSIIGNDKLNIQKAEGKLIATTTGGMSSHASYDTYYFRVPVAELTVKCTNGFRACISLTDPSGDAQTANLKQLLYTYASGRVETFTAHLNDWVAISIAKSTGAIDLQTNYANAFSFPGLRLDWRQQNSFYRYVAETNAKRLYIYYKSGNKYVRWELHNVPAAASNSDTWQIGAVYGYDEKLVTGVELVGAGEFELAFKEYGAADYCGGNNHGDETQDDFTLMIDGKVITLTDLDSAYHAFNRIDAIEHATINRCDTPAEDILKHQKVWVFENGTVKIRQTLKFLEALECDFLCCMLPAYRSAFTHGIRQGGTATEVMTTSTFEKISTSGNEMMYLMYGTNASAKVIARCMDHTPSASLWINNAAALNKLYYNFFGQMPRTSVANGTVLHWESEYDVAYN